MNESAVQRCRSASFSSALRDRASRDLVTNEEGTKAVLLGDLFRKRECRCDTNQIRI